jgi:hypothetical protein
MELGCVVFLFGVPIMIWMFIEYIREHSKNTYPPPKTSSLYPNLRDYNQKVKVTGRSDLTSWALHKHPQDIDAHDYRDFSMVDDDVVIYREGSVNKIVKGPDRGRILEDWEVEDYINTH